MSRVRRTHPKGSMRAVRAPAWRPRAGNTAPGGSNRPSPQRARHGLRTKRSPGGAGPRREQHPPHVLPEPPRDGRRSLPTASDHAPLPASYTVLWPVDRVNPEIVVVGPTDLVELPGSEGSLRLHIGEYRVPPVEEALRGRARMGDIGPARREVARGELLRGYRRLGAPRDLGGSGCPAFSTRSRGSPSARGRPQVSHSADHYASSSWSGSVNPSPSPDDSLGRRRSSNRFSMASRRPYRPWSL